MAVDEKPQSSSSVSSTAAEPSPSLPAPSEEGCQAGPAPLPRQVEIISFRDVGDDSEGSDEAPLPFSAQPSGTRTEVSAPVVPVAAFTLSPAAAASATTTGRPSDDASATNARPKTRRGHRQSPGAADTHDGQPSPCAASSAPGSPTAAQVSAASVSAFYPAACERPVSRRGRKGAPGYFSHRSDSPLPEPPLSHACQASSHTSGSDTDVESTGSDEHARDGAGDGLLRCVSLPEAWPVVAQGHAEGAGGVGARRGDGGGGGGGLSGVVEEGSRREEYLKDMAELSRSVTHPDDMRVAVTFLRSLLHMRETLNTD